MSFIDGAYACPGCEGLVTAWRGNRRVGPFFEADHYDPYQPHMCRQPDPTLTRIAAALEALLGQLHRESAAQPAQQPPSNGAQPRTVVRTVPTPTDKWGLDR